MIPRTAGFSPTMWGVIIAMVVAHWLGYMAAEIIAARKRSRNSALLAEREAKEIASQSEKRRRRRRGCWGLLLRVWGRTFVAVHDKFALSVESLTSLATYVQETSGITVGSTTTSLPPKASTMTDSSADENVGPDPIATDLMDTLRVNLNPHPHLLPGHPNLNPDLNTYGHAYAYACMHARMPVGDPPCRRRDGSQPSQSWRPADTDRLLLLHAAGELGFLRFRRRVRLLHAAGEVPSATPPPSLL